MNQCDLPPYTAWQLVCRSRDIASGSLKKVTFSDREVTLYRTEGGSLCGVDPACPHMGADLSNGEVVGETIRCPLHHLHINGFDKTLSRHGGECANFAGKGYEVQERWGGVFLSVPSKEAGFPESFNKSLETYETCVGNSVKIQCPWFVMSGNAFDVLHLESVHGRKPVNPPDFQNVGKMAILKYESRVTGNRISDRVIRRLSGNRIQVEMQLDRGTLLMGKSRLRKVESRLLLCFSPNGDGTIVTPIYATPRSSFSALDRLRLLFTRILFNSFIYNDVKIMENMKFRRPECFRDDAFEEYLLYIDNLTEQKN